MPEEEFDPLSLLKIIFQRKQTAEKTEEQSNGFARFLDLTESLDHNERVKLAINLGKESLSRDDSEAARAKAILSALENGNFYERTLALYSCHATKNRALIIRMTEDRSSLIRNLARNLSVQFCNDEELLEILRHSCREEQKRLVKKIRRRHRQSLLDKFLRELQQENPEDFQKLVYFGSPELVKQSLEKLAEFMDYRESARFSYMHPGLCIDFLSSLCEHCDKNDPRLYSLFWSASRWIAVFQPDRALKLTEKLLSLFPSSKLSTEILRLRPAETVRLFAKQKNYGGARFAGYLDRLPEDLLLDCVKQGRIADEAAVRFKKLPSAIREKVFKLAADGWRNGDGAVAANIIELLPRQLREEEAQRHFSLPNLAGRTNEKLSYARLLKSDSVEREFAESLNSSAPEIRSVAFFHYVYSVRLHREKLFAVLELLHKHKNEADPVRNMFLSALSVLPPSAFRKENLPQLDLIIKDAEEAHDLSAGSISHIGRLLLRLFAFHREWVAQKLSLLLKERGSYFLSYGSPKLAKAEIRILDDHLQTVLSFWLSREKEEETCQLAGWMQSGLKYSPGVVNALRQIALSAKSTQNSQAAAGILYAHMRKEFEKLVPELLKTDESWGLQPLIYKFLGDRKQSLLTPYLGQNLLKGRFGSGKSRVIPDFWRGFHKWTSNQQKIYARELSLLAESNTADHGDRLFGARRLCRLPEPPAETLSRLASLENKDLSIRDYTIRDIAAADNGSGLPILLECLRDERDRQAIYALKTMLPSMGAEKSLELLSSIKSEKITVFKEVLRLAGEIGSTESYNWLLQQEKTPLHRDARLALLRAVWDYPERQETWELMRKAIASGDQSYADCAIRLPVEHRSSEAKRNKLLIYAEALLSKSVIVRIETLYLIASGSILDPQQLLVAPLSTCLSSPNADECRAASRAATHLYAGRKSEVLSKYIETLSDLPRNLSIYIQQIQMHLSERPDAYRQDLNLISEELIQKPKTLALLISLAGSLMPLEDFYELLVKVEKAGNLHYGNMRAAETALIQPAQNCSAEELEKLEKQLHSESSDRLRRLGLAALCGLAQCAGGWTPARLAKLRDYRKDSSLLVSSAAEFTLPPAEFAVQAAGS